MIKRFIYVLAMFMLRHPIILTRQEHIAGKHALGGKNVENVDSADKIDVKALQSVADD